MPRWAPPVAGLLGGGGITLMYMALFGPAIDLNVLVAGIVVALMFAGLVAWLRRAWKRGGVIPRTVMPPLESWWQIVLFMVVVTTVTGVGSFLGGQTGSLRWLFVPFGLLIGGWFWFALAWPRAGACRN